MHVTNIKKIERKFMIKCKESKFTMTINNLYGNHIKKIKKDVAILLLNARKVNLMLTIND